MIESDADDKIGICRGSHMKYFHNNAANSQGRESSVQREPPSHLYKVVQIQSKAGGMKKKGKYCVDTREHQPYYRGRSMADKRDCVESLWAINTYRVG